MFKASQRSEAEPNQWSLSLLHQLDWKRFHELTHAIIHRGGYRALPDSVKPDGGCTVTLMRNNAQARRPEARMAVAGWNGLRVNSVEMQSFIAEVMDTCMPHGVFVTPGTFAPEARALASQGNVELVDGPAFLDTLRDLPLNEQEFLLRLATAGDFQSPSCPHCQVKMVLRASEAPRHDGPLPDLHFKHSDTVSHELRCGTLNIPAGVEVLFLKPVHAEYITLSGRATGSMVCNGQVVIGPGAVYTGLIAARSINVKEGGTLDGEASILSAEEIQPVRPIPQPPVWGCPNYPACCGVLDVRHPE